MTNGSVREAELHLATAQTLSDMSFFASSTQASEAAKLNLRRFTADGQCKLSALNNEECEQLAKELNQAIFLVIDKWRKRSVAKAKEILSKFGTDA